MTTRAKTVEYSFTALNSSLAADTRNDFTQITLYIPETTSRNFTSVAMYVWARQDDDAATSLTSCLMGIKLGATDFEDGTCTSTLTNTGDHASWQFSRDITSYFTTYFGAGASQTCQVGVQFGAVVTSNVSVKLIISYDYDDSATIRLKTVRIPLESATANLTNTLAEIGTNQIPCLNTFLPEHSKVYRDIFFEIYSNEANALGTTDFSLELQTGSDTTYNTYSLNQALNTGVQFYHIWKRTDLNTDSTNSFKARSNNVTSRFNCLSPILNVTYQYDHTDSTQIINSLMYALSGQGGYIGGDTSTSASVYVKEIPLYEPNAAPLVQSGVLFSLSGSAAITLNVQGLSDTSGQSNFRTYTLTAASTQAGDRYICHRIDSGSSIGEAINLTGSVQTKRLCLEAYRTGTTTGTLCSSMKGFLYFNYYSSRHSLGDHVHNHTVFKLLQETIANAQSNTTVEVGPTFLNVNTSYVSGYDFWLPSMINVGSAALSVSAHATGYEITGVLSAIVGGWKNLDTSLYESDAELGCTTYIFSASQHYTDYYYLRYPPKILSAGINREYRIECSSVNFWAAMYLFVTYHDIAFTVSGHLIGTSTPNSVNVFITDVDTYRVLRLVPTDTTGGYTATIPFYDNIQSHAYDFNSLLPGASIRGLPPANI